jgi:hypothetical protein
MQSVNCKTKPRRFADHSRGVKLKNMVNIDQIKETAIEETVIFFTEKYGINPDRYKLLKWLNSETANIDEYTEAVLKHKEELLKQGNKEELLKEFKDSFTKIETVLNKMKFIKYTTNDTNTSKLIDVINQFCEYSILCRFFSEQIIEFNQPINISALPDGLIIDDILNSMFSLTTAELENLKNNLFNKGRQYISLTYIGTKASLWIDLGKLLSAGIDRNEISRVFSEYCHWQKSTASAQFELNSDEIYKKIVKKGIK